MKTINTKIKVVEDIKPIINNEQNINNIVEDDVIIIETTHKNLLKDSMTILKTFEGHSF